MTKKRRNGTTPGSIAIGLLTFGLLGFSIYNGLLRLGVITSNTFILTFLLGAGTMLGLFLGIRFPILTETLSFAITALVAIQGTWDIIFDIQNGFADKRVLAVGVAISIFILNIFTGKLKLGTAKQQIRRTIGTN